MRLGRLVVIGALLGGLVAPLGCGSGRPPPEKTDLIPPVATNNPSFEAGTRKPPGCGQKDDGSFCDCVDVPLFGDAPNMYFVLDRSGSMAENGKWDQVRNTVAKVMRDLGPRANFGATVFPGDEASNRCSSPKEVMTTRPGDSPASDKEPTTSFLINATSAAPSGGTPTAAAMRFVLPIVKSLPGKTFVVLATDGGPNCNELKACPIEQCMPNIEGVDGCDGSTNCCEPPIGDRGSCLDGDDTILAINALKNAGYPVYVIGIPGTERYGALLDNFAVAGGTPQSGPKYFKVDSPELLQGTMRKIAARIIASCTIKLKSPPEDPNLVNVYVDETVVPQDGDGWKIEGDTVTLLGRTCARILNGDSLDLRVIVGCPTQKPR